MDAASTEPEIQHEEDGHRGTFFLERDGKRLARLTYSRANEGLVIIDHTEVDASLSGQGAGARLVEAAVEWARATGTKIIPVCPFAAAQFRRRPELRDVLS